MNAEIKKQWVDALRSGHYAQGQGRLRQCNNFCCLGVLCDLYSNNHPEAWDDADGGADYEFMDNATYLPDAVIQWADLTKYQCGDFGDIKVSWADDESTLASLNDNCHTFAEIADIIEKQL